MSELAKISNGDFSGNVVFEKGVVKVECKLDGKGLDAGVYVTIPCDYFLDKLAESIPGQIDDTVIALIKSALKA